MAGNGCSRQPRRRRQEQGIERAKAKGAFKGRPEDAERNAALLKMLKAGMSYKTIIDSTKTKRKDGTGYDMVSSSTLARLAKRVKDEQRKAEQGVA